MFVALFFQWKNVHENESYVLEWQQTLHWIIPTVHQSQTKGRKIRRPNFWTSACLKKKMSRGRTAEEKPRWRPKWTKTLQNMHNAISDTVVKKSTSNTHRWSQRCREKNPIDRDAHLECSKLYECASTTQLTVRSYWTAVYLKKSPCILYHRQTMTCTKAGSGKLLSPPPRKIHLKPSALCCFGACACHLWSAQASRTSKSHLWSKNVIKTNTCVNFNCGCMLVRQTKCPIAVQSFVVRNWTFL